MIKELKSGLVALLISAMPVVAQTDINNIVHLDRNVYDGLHMSPYTTYVGTLPIKNVNELKIDILNKKEIPVNIINKEYTIIKGEIEWGQDSKLSYVQIDEIESLGYMGFTNSLTDSIVYGNKENDGLEVASAGNIVDNNIFLNFRNAIQFSDSTYLPCDVTNNLLCFNDCGLGIVYNVQMQEGNNIIFMNEENAKVSQADYENPVTLEGNWWYDEEGYLLETEADILETVRYDTGVIPIKSISGFVDVVPFYTTEPYAITDYSLDSDGDGVTDNREITWGTDPYDPDSVPDLPLGSLALATSLLGAGIYTLKKRK